VLNLNAIPLWTAIAVEILGWVVVCSRLFLIMPPRVKWRVPIAVVVGAVLLQSETAIQGASARTTAWLALVVCGTIGGATVGRRAYFREYFELQKKYGERSPEVRKFATPLTVTILVIAAGLLTCSAIFLKGITFKH
jgi:hypothetical protein